MNYAAVQYDMLMGVQKEDQFASGIMELSHEERKDYIVRRIETATPGQIEEAWKIIFEE